MRLPRLYRLFRITRIIKLLKVSKNSPTMSKLQDFFRLKQSAIRLLTVFVSVAVIAHICTCLWYFMAKLEGFGPDTWVY
jgi:hyperpolarization activated cyclic nucleotide-gated potassium channel 1